ncbi:MAG: iron-sulfur cluster assembly scaffold protein [Woeseiaceae bacterium]|nr:iron-sulfur cluster assembly scaffold protein [Woeseiaceae bacterium]
MSPDPYSDRVRELFARPGHAGVLEGNCSAAVVDQGVKIRLTAHVRDGRVEAMAFLAYGCPHVIAAAEAACAELEGRSAVELLEFPATGLMQSLSVPVEKTGRILVLEDAVRSLGRVITEMD